MKKTTIFLCSLALVFSVVGVAGAVPTTWTDFINFRPDRYLGNDLFYVHDISDGDNGFQGYSMGGDDVVYGYALQIALRDDYDRRNEGEVAFINQPGISGDGYYNFNYTSQTFGWSLAGLLSLNWDGRLGVTIDRRAGDFYVNYSRLVARGDNGSGTATGTAPVPEPSTILLMGAGLLGLVAVGRRKFNRKE